MLRGLNSTNIALGGVAIMGAMLLLLVRNSPRPSNLTVMIENGDAGVMRNVKLSVDDQSYFLGNIPVHTGKGWQVFTPDGLPTVRVAYTSATGQRKRLLIRDFWHKKVSQGMFAFTIRAGKLESVGYY